jgi:hypothetical protein
MGRVLVAALAILAISGGGSAVAQQAEAAARPAVQHIVWSFDPVRGLMQPTPVASSAAPAATASAAVVPGAVADATASSKTYTGTIDITVTVNLISTLPAKAALRCTGSVELPYQVESTNGTLPPLFLSSLVGANTTENVNATVAAGIATCRFTLPYSWTVPLSTSTTKVTIEGIAGSVGIAADELDANGAVIRAYRSNSVQLTGPTTIPQDGSTTMLTASTVL